MIYYETVASGKSDFFWNSQEPAISPDLSNVVRFVDFGEYFLQREETVALNIIS